jgi:hypothetical protein
LNTDADLPERETWIYARLVRKQYNDLIWYLRNIRFRGLRHTEGYPSRFGNVEELTLSSPRTPVPAANPQKGTYIE